MASLCWDCHHHLFWLFHFKKNRLKLLDSCNFKRNIAYYSIFKKKKSHCFKHCLFKAIGKNKNSTKTSLVRVMQDQSNTAKIVCLHHLM